MRQAKDYIVFPLDVPTMAEARKYVRELASYVGMFKVGMELFIQCGPSVVAMIREESDAAVFLDLKLYDIPATVSRAMARIAGLQVDWATVHCGESRAMLEAAAAAGGDRVGVLGVTILTSVSEDDLAAAGFRESFSKNLFQLVLKRAMDARAAGCAGIVCSGREVAAVKSNLGRDFVAVIPGIRPAAEDLGEDDDQQRVVTPAQAIADGADYLVIGRPIRDAPDPAMAARRIGEEIAGACRELNP